MATIVVKSAIVPDMSCEGCVKSIQKALMELPSVRSVTANLEQSLVTVTWDDEVTDWDAIKAKLEEIDYPAERAIESH